MEWLYNFTPKNLERWSYALAQTRTGRYDSKLLLIGDSTTAGGNSTSYAGGRANAPATALTAALVAAGIVAECNSFFCDAHVFNASYPQYDPRVMMGAGWGFYTASNSLGGYMFNGGGATGTLLFSPANNVDTFAIYTLNNSSFAVFVDGSLALTVSGTIGNDTIRKLTVSAGSLGTHSIGILPPAGSTSTYIIGVDAYDSTKRRVAVLNAGMGGSKAGDWTDSTSGWSPLNAIEFMAPDLALINLGINDETAGTTTATYTSQIQTVINAVQQSGDVILVVPNPIAISGTPSAPASTQKAFRDALYSLADSNGCPLVDLVRGMASGAIDGSGGWADTEHPSAALYQAIGTALKEAVL